ncbi:hypothetical protein [Janibacter anophelis]|nr:hypothetical protein [Janibacter anophelis]
MRREHARWRHAPYGRPGLAEVANFEVIVDILREVKAHASPSGAA